MTATLDQLLARTTPDPDTGCLCWQGAKNSNGYGRVRRDGRVALVHRVACELAHGPIPAGYVVDHVAARGCAHVDCINPAHLEAVTASENLRRSSLPQMVTARTGVCANGHRIEGDNAKRESSQRGRYSIVRCRRCANERHQRSKLVA